MFDPVKNATHPCLFWSSGNDSTLLLAMMIDAGLKFDIVQHRSLWTREQKKRADALIAKYNLKVFDYPPAQTSFIGQGDEISVVEEFAVNGGVIPLIRDVIPGDECIASLNGHKAVQPPFLWDLIVCGSRQDDRHYAFDNQVIPNETWTVGKTTFYAPLYSWRRQEVADELKRRDLYVETIDETDTGNLSLCTKCLHGVETFCPLENSIIPPVRWDMSANLAAFRAAYAA